MFTGIIEELGTIKKIITTTNLLKVEIMASLVLEKCCVGASISVNGCCLTVVNFSSSSFWVDIVNESKNKTWLKDLSIGEKVNLERPLAMGERLDGHIVQGHVDHIGEVSSLKEENDGSFKLEIKLPFETMKYFVEKGSIAVDGVSLTISDLLCDGVQIALIPHTLKNTNLKNTNVRINLKFLEHTNKRIIKKPVTPNLSIRTGY